ncbi:MAG TPA: hypothetical protein VFZ66_25080 [Herpetosiphonaceae bacterium]
MSRLIDTTELRHRDIFALPTGSVYRVEVQADTTGPLQARLWCAHPPDPATAHPPLIDLPPGPVRLLIDRHETGIHVRHDGYVKQVFVTEMNRRHQDQMRRVYATMQRTAEADRKQADDRKPWWRKLFA